MTYIKIDVTNGVTACVTLETPLCDTCDGFVTPFVTP